MNTTDTDQSKNDATEAQSPRGDGLGGSPVRPSFGPGEIVSHITDESARGVIVAFMVRANNHSYQVQWGVEKCEWHLDFELRRLPEKPKEIGFWSADGKPNDQRQARAEKGADDTTD